MATATVVISDKQLESDLDRFRKESAEIQKRLDTDNSKLTAARAELQRLVEQIAAGSAEAGVLQRVKNEMETLEIRIGGLNKQLATNRTTAEQLQKEIGRRQAAAAKEAREKEFAELVKQGQSAQKKIFEKLTQLVAEDIPAFDELRTRLGVEFRDLGGEAAAVHLREMLSKAPHPSERAHVPDVHLWKLLAEGWVFAANAGPRYRSSDGGYFSMPGGELNLTVCSLRPKK
jgi:DNA repair ATPase RecN